MLPKRFVQRAASAAVVVCLVAGLMRAAPAGFDAAAYIRHYTSACGHSALTEDRFLQLVNTIAMHDDLTDVPFIERTLQLKFTPVDTSGSILDHRVYLANMIFGAPISVYYYIRFRSREHPSNDWQPKLEEAEVSIKFNGLS
jgi:hypothetical protein